MSAFDNAAQFFHACETAQGWAGCKQYVAANASFTAQSIPLEGIDTVEAYCEWMANFGNNIVPGCSYDLHASSYDETKPYRNILRHVYRHPQRRRRTGTADQ